LRLAKILSLVSVGVSPISIVKILDSTLAVISTSASALAANGPT
jgi:hypothetical protein